MSTKKSENAKKIKTLQKIRNSKVFFGAFPPDLIEQSKAEEWKKIHSFALSIGVTNWGKDFVYVRDTYSPNISWTTPVSIVLYFYLVYWYFFYLFYLYISYFFKAMYVQSVYFFQDVRCHFKKRVTTV